MAPDRNLLDLLQTPVAEVPNGGGERTRTDDLLLAKQALSQLSYTPRARDQKTAIRHQKL